MKSLRTLSKQAFRSTPQPAVKGSGPLFGVQVQKPFPLVSFMSGLANLLPQTRRTEGENGVVCFRET
jgi:hypothetical protein